jgi:hypothetical protein
MIANRYIYQLHLDAFLACAFSWHGPFFHFWERLHNQLEERRFLADEALTTAKYFQGVGRVTTASPVDRARFSGGHNSVCAHHVQKLI